MHFICCPSSKHLFIGQGSWIIATEPLKFQTPPSHKDQVYKKLLCFNFLFIQNPIFILYSFVLQLFSTSRQSFSCYLCPQHESHLTFVSWIYADCCKSTERKGFLCMMYIRIKNIGSSYRYQRKNFKRFDCKSNRNYSNLSVLHTTWHTSNDS